MDAAREITANDSTHHVQMAAVDVSATSILDKYCALLRQNPADPHQWLSMAMGLKEDAHVDQALICVQRALRLDPRLAAAWHCQGNLWLTMGHCRQGVRAHRMAVELRPERIDYQLGYARALREAGDHQSALQVIDNCLLCDPGRRDARYERALNYLQMGNYRRAWLDMGARTQHPLIESGLLKAIPWQGERIGTKRLLLVAEPDQAESAWALRYIPLLARRGADLHLACSADWGRLVADLTVTVWRDDDPALQEMRFDFVAGLLSLPGIHDCNGLCLPEPPSLHVPAAATRSLTRRVARDDAFLKVGIACGGQPHGVACAMQLERLADLPGVALFWLQAGPNPAQCGGDDISTALYDIGDLAAAVDQMDLVVCVENVVAHLAGSLNKPALVLLRANPHWIFGQLGDACSSYATLKLLRPRSEMDTDDMLRTVFRLVSGWATRRIATAMNR